MNMSSPYLLLQSPQPQADAPRARGESLASIATVLIVGSMFALGFLI